MHPFSQAGFASFLCKGKKKATSHFRVMLLKFMIMLQR